MPSAIAPSLFESSSPPVSTPERAGPSDDVAGVGFGIYVHWPFCLAKCPYCDFNSHVRDRVDQSRWRRALLAEIEHYAKDTEGRTVTSVFFGGGTPSLMAPETVAAVLDHVATRWPTAAGLEVTLEANPTSAEAGRFAAYRAAGVNRVSLGVQALDDEALRFLGRGHTVREALSAVEMAASVFPRFSFDLIYARPGQTATAWRCELRRAVRFARGHLSLYQLTVEPGTAFHRRRLRGELSVPDEVLAAALYDVTQEALEVVGLSAYEVSNHAARGEACRHNLTYWRYGDYVGIGPGAHGRLSVGGRTFATSQHRSPESWIAAVERHGHATRARDPLEHAALRDEMAMMGLRLVAGIDRTWFRKRTGLEIEESFGKDVLSRLVDGGFLILDRAGLRATSVGLRRLDAVLVRLLS
ncbi:MAG: radical SAM family heme chaperone HemW [Alphaproteobacteria bacterium]